MSNDFDFITDRLAIGCLASRATPGFVAVVSVVTVKGRHRGRPWGAELTEKTPQVPNGAEVEWSLCDDDCQTSQPTYDISTTVPVLVIDIADGEASGDKTAFSCSHEDDRDLDRFLTQATAFIASEIRFGCVLVHCGAGVSRSAAVVIAYLCRYGMSYTEALAFVKTKRPQVAPANVFKEAIERWLDLDKLTTTGPRG